MAQVHGKSGALLIATKDVSPYTKSIDFDQSADSHDTTTFGATGHTYSGGLTDGKVSLAGVYDNTASVGPRGAIKANLGLTVAFRYRPEGVGTGRPEDQFNVVVTGYKESVPVDDMIQWSADLQISGAVTTISQP